MEKAPKKETIRKAASIDLAGRKALQERALAAFEGFGEAAKGRFISALTFSHDSEQQLHEQVTKDIERIEHELQIHFALAGRDFPIHATVAEGRYTDDKTRTETFKQLQSDEHLTPHRNLPNISLTFDYLLFDKGNILLVASQIPQEVTSMRDDLKKVYESHGLSHKPIENLLHITIGRMDVLPASESEYDTYTERIIALRHNISKKPLTLITNELFVGCTFDFLHQLNT